MRAFVRSMSFGAEFTITILAAFGLSILGSLLYLYGLLALPDGPSLQLYSSHSLYWTFFTELAVLSVLAVFLRWRGWRLRDLHPEVSLKFTLVGILMVLVYYVIHYNLAFIFANVFPSVGRFAELFTANLGRPDPLSVILVSMMNPVFEEVFVAAYVITALREKKGLHFAVNTSVAIRLLYHVYQGPLAAISIVPMGLLFGYVYARTERLWPLIVAHAIVDLIALSSLM